MNPTVEVEVRRNRHGSVLAYADRDRAVRLLADHRAVLQSLYDLVDRRHGADGEIVARLAIREDARTVDELDLRDRFRRDLDPNRAIALVEDLRYHAGEHELVTDGGTAQDDLEIDCCAACGNMSEESSLGYSDARDELVCSECVAFLGQNGYYPDEDGPDRSVTVTYELGGDL